MMMPTSMKSFLAVAALAFACSLVGPRPMVAQDEQGKAESAAATQPAAGTPVAEPAPVGTTETQPRTSEPPTAESIRERARQAAIQDQQSPTAPPRNLRKVGDHWTPYNPPDPESFPPDATLHIIVKGETLWGLADLSYNDPYLWPQLWDQNRYITDSHWIYPGDPLLVPPRPRVVTPTGSGVPSEIVPPGQEGAAASSLDPFDEGDGLEGPLAAETPAGKPGPEGPAADLSSGD